MNPGETRRPWSVEYIFNLCLGHGAVLKAYLWPEWGIWAASHFEPIEDEI